MSSILANRTKGMTLPLSVGTAIALESFLGINKENPLPAGFPPPYQSHNHLVINLSTLARNIISTVKPVELDDVSFNDIRYAIEDEINLIENILERETGGKVSCSFYYNNYRKLSKLLRDAKIKTNFTGRQLYHHKVETEIPLKVKARGSTIEYTDYKITYGKRTNAILTHMAVDLLLFEKPNFVLLESYTGRIKRPNEFNTKLKYGNEDTPFNKETIQVFGDKSGFILPMDSKTRTAVLNLFKEVNIGKLIDDKLFIKRVKSSKDKQTTARLLSLT